MNKEDILGMPRWGKPNSDKRLGFSQWGFESVGIILNLQITVL